MSMVCDILYSSCMVRIQAGNCAGYGIRGLRRGALGAGSHRLPRALVHLSSQFCVQWLNQWLNVDRLKSGSTYTTEISKGYKSGSPWTASLLHNWGRVKVWEPEVDDGRCHLPVLLKCWLRLTKQSLQGNLGILSTSIRLLKVDCKREVQRGPWETAASVSSCLYGSAAKHLGVGW